MVTDEYKQNLVNLIHKTREAILRLLKIAPDTVPYTLCELARQPTDKTSERLEEELAAREDDEAKEAFCQLLIVGLSAVGTKLERFEAELQLRTQPDNQPRAKRKFQGFKKRKGAW